MTTSQNLTPADAVLARRFGESCYNQNELAPDRAGMTTLCRALLALVLTSSCLNAHAANFQLKGITLGARAATACGKAPVTDRYGELVRQSRAQAPDLVEMGTTECEVEFASFGGNALASPARLLFLNDALILIKFELNGLSMTSFVDILKAFQTDYGNAKRVISRPFVTDTWKQHGQTLILERTGREWDDNDTVIILRQDAGFQIYQRRSDTNRRILERLEARQKRDDIR